MALHCLPLLLLSSVAQLPYVSNNQWAGYDDDIYHLQAGGAPPGASYLSADDYDYYGVSAADLAPVDLAYDDGDGAGSYDAAEGKASLEESSAVGHALLTPPIAAAAFAAVIGFTAFIVAVVQRRQAHSSAQATPAATAAHPL